jgi:hypothetical protein
VTPKGMKLLVFKEITPGDLRKITAKAADASTGRGARDFRFPHQTFDPIFGRLLPTVVEMPGRRGKKATSVVVRKGPVRWFTTESVEMSTDVEYWPPNEARPSEGRWAKVNSIPLFRGVPEDEGRIFLLLIQDDENITWLYIKTETDLRSPEWDQTVINVIFTCVDSRKTARNATQGYIDFEQDKTYCNG